MNHQKNNGGRSVCNRPGGRLVTDRAKVDCPACLAAPVPVMGRPSRAGAPTHVVGTRATDEEEARWREAAGAASLSEWLRALANKAAPAA